jgi:hypothetical protein
MVSRARQGCGAVSRGGGYPIRSWLCLLAAIGGLPTVGCASAYDCYRGGAPTTAYRPQPPLPHTPLYRPLDTPPAAAACVWRPLLDR